MKPTPIDLDPKQVLERTRQALHQLLECWDMEYGREFEPRDEINEAATLLDIVWENERRAKR
tara:strand:- start:661 stop:846 length:186 start_codon:yes stop_codon:yes gene_type:complete